jgi:asparagine synthase (glutamine-hydrolysing)
MVAQSLRRWLALRTLDPVTRAVVKDHLTYLPIEKLRRIQRALDQSSGIDGDILEFGVALGGSGIILAHGAKGARRFIGFDVFGMIPPPTSDKDDAKSRQRYETIRSGQSKGIAGDEYYGYRTDLFEDVRAAFARHGVPVDGSKVMLVKGLFEETWPTVAVGSIALAHIDCDWYDPVKFCLDVCADKLGEGGIVIIDDYNDYGGCRTAVDEFLAARPDFTFEPGLNPFLRKHAAGALRS